MTAPRWLREQRRRHSVTVQLEDLHHYVDQIWVDQYQLLRNAGVRSCVDPRRDDGPEIRVERPQLRLVHGG